LANYRFDARTGGAVRMSQNGTRAGVAPTNVVVLRDGVVYFEGDTRTLEESKDPYLKEFLSSAE
jgi:ABC-type transporter Mla maintaining outer membrane lipid asymmetry ATPase subunit MlaF